MTSEGIFEPTIDWFHLYSQITRKHAGVHFIGHNHPYPGHHQDGTAT
jgi:hypothetical protein